MHRSARLQPSIVQATRGHAPFLARVILAASRSHLRRGPFDVALDLADTQLLAIIERMTLSDLAGNCHYTRFLVAEVEGVPAGALAAFDPSEADLPPLSAVLLDVCATLGYSRRELAHTAARLDSLARCFPCAAPGTWTIEWVSVDEAHRGRGICGGLMEAILAEGRRRTRRTAQVSTYMCNQAARIAYERAGFRAAQTHQDPACSELLGVSGVMIMRRDLA